MSRKTAEPIGERKRVFRRIKDALPYETVEKLYALVGSTPSGKRRSSRRGGPRG